jgi:hypothetical protein
MIIDSSQLSFLGKASKYLSSSSSSRNGPYGSLSHRRYRLPADSANTTTALESWNLKFTIIYTS